MLASKRMIEFIAANKLKNKFSVFGHFYSIDIGSAKNIDCRSVLEIATINGASTNAGALSEKCPDAVFIMMNPGSSQPLIKANNLVSLTNIGSLESSLVPTKPDITQYQLMRVMYYCNWKHVRVLNLSDMRDTRSRKFIERYRKIEEDPPGVEEHSIFSDARENELKNKLNLKSGSHVICAWGVSPDLDPLIKRCVNKISYMSEVKGLLKTGSTNKYFHPSPILQLDKEKWIHNMVKQIKK